MVLVLVSLREVVVDADAGEGRGRRLPAFFLLYEQLYTQDIAPKAVYTFISCSVHKKHNIKNRRLLLLLSVSIQSFLIGVL